MVIATNNVCVEIIYLYWFKGFPLFSIILNYHLQTGDLVMLLSLKAVIFLCFPPANESEH